MAERWLTYQQAGDALGMTYNRAGLSLHNK